MPTTVSSAVPSCTAGSIGSGYGIPGNAHAIALAEQDPRIFAAVGFHPHEAADVDDAARRKLETWLGHERVVALGECGLDYHYMNAPREVQRSVFAEQISLARERDMPVSIHVRGDEPNAYDELLDIWTAEGHGEIEGVLHCYTGTLDFALRALPHGFYHYVPEVFQQAIPVAGKSATEHAAERLQRARKW